MLYDIKSRGAIAYLELAKKILSNREGMMPPKTTLGKGLGAIFPDILEKSTKENLSSSAV